MYELDTKCDICGDTYDSDRPTTHRHCELSNYEAMGRAYVGFSAKHPLSRSAPRGLFDSDPSVRRV